MHKRHKWPKNERIVVISLVPVEASARSSPPIVSVMRPAVNLNKRSIRTQKGTVTIMAPQQVQTPIVIPMEDVILHTQSHPFCSDPTCPCKEDPELLSDVAQAVGQGLLTPEEATQVITAKAV